MRLVPAPQKEQRAYERQVEQHRPKERFPQIGAQTDAEQPAQMTRHEQRHGAGQWNGGAVRVADDPVVGTVNLRRALKVMNENHAEYQVDDAFAEGHERPRLMFADAE